MDPHHGKKMNVQDYFERHGHDGYCSLIRSRQGEDLLFIVQTPEGLCIGDMNCTPAADVSDTDVDENVRDWCLAIGVDYEDADDCTLYPHGLP